MMRYFGESRVRLDQTSLTLPPRVSDLTKGCDEFWILLDDDCLILCPTAGGEEPAFVAARGEVDGETSIALRQTCATQVNSDHVIDIPRDYLEAFDIYNNEAVLIGVFDRFELFKPSDWESPTEPATQS